MKPNPVHDFLVPIINGRHFGSGTGPNSECSRDPKPNPKCGTDGPSLWSAFWQEFYPEGRPWERCPIPGDGRYAVDRHWAHFAAALPRDARVIDLGCGAGIVGRILLHYRNDLRVTGIDFADVPTPEVANLTIHPWVSMEALPFDDGRFDAAISLFGIEYGNIGKTAQELERVLKPGARFSFLVHHCESEIVCEGSTRRRGLRELLSGRVKAAFLGGSVAAIEQQIGRLKKQFPDEPSVRHFSRYLHHHITRTRAERQAKWQYLLDGLAPELALLMHLERSAKSAVEIGSWLPSLLAIMKVVSVSILRRSSGEPIAWQVSGSR
jgi:ubiquinone/menaquinone biosynthesis C-methylase UbiE